MTAYHRERLPSLCCEKPQSCLQSLPATFAGLRAFGIRQHSVGVK
jgi:hypothetical protein